MLSLLHSSRIAEGLELSTPQLETLVLTNNNIEELVCVMCFEGFVLFIYRECVYVLTERPGCPDVSTNTHISEVRHSFQSTEWIRLAQYVVCFI